MFTCNLSPDEAEIIIEILEQVLDDLRSKQRPTEHSEYKPKLEQPKVVLRKVISELNKSHLVQESSRI